MGERGPELGGVTGVGRVVERREPVNWEERSGAQDSVNASYYDRPLLVCEVTTV